MRHTLYAAFGAILTALAVILLATLAAFGAPAPLPKAPAPLPMGYGDGYTPRPFAEVWENSAFVRRFPALAVARSNRALAYDHLNWLCDREKMYSDDANLKAAIADQEKRTHAWNALFWMLVMEYHNPGTYYDETSGWWLAQYITPEQFAAGIMPAPAAWWTFRGN